MSRQKPVYFPIQGGLNLIAPAISKGNGELLFTKNYEPSVSGGIKPTGGYEAFDGQNRPWDTILNRHSYTVGNGTQPVAGDAITTGGTTTIAAVTVDSGTWAGGDAAGYIYTYNTFSSSTGAVSIDNGATCTLDTDIQTDTTTSYRYMDSSEQTYFNVAREANRDLIAAVPGEGNILGVCIYNDVVYAVRNASGGATAVMFKSTSSGWSSVKTGLSPDGRYEFDVYDFGNGAMLYGCDGVNKAFQWDGTTFTQLTSGLATDTPEHIKAHRNYLFVSYQTEIYNSALGDPADWTAINGADNRYTSHNVTAFESVIGGVFIVFTENRTYTIEGLGGGTAADNFRLKPYSDTSGAFAYSVATETTPVFLSEQGITVLGATEQFGNFQTASLSQKIKPWIDAKKQQSLIAGAALDIDNSLYRLYFTDGKVVNMLFNGQQGGDITHADYEINLTCIGTGKIGDERYILAGCDDGFVYQMEMGESMNGSAIESFCKLTYSHFGTPQHKKRLFQVEVELDAPTGVQLELTPDFSYGSTDRPQSQSYVIDVEGSGGTWNVDNWDEFLWDNQVVSQAAASTDGSGTNISLSFYTSTTNKPQYTLQGVTYHLGIRGMKY